MRARTVLAGVFGMLVCLLAVPSGGSAPLPILEQRGCCSWHNGVCGCTAGRVTCCDGTTSPSCKC